MYEMFKVTFSQICVLYAFIGIGYLISKKEIVPRNFGKGISNLVVYIFMPFLTFGTFAENFRFDVLSEQGGMLLASSAILALFLVIAFVFAKALASNSNERDVYLYSFTFPNAGYFGYPLIAAIFGEQALFNFMILHIPFLVLTYTFGIYVLNPDKKWTWKKLFDPEHYSLGTNNETSVFMRVCGVAVHFYLL